MFATLTTGRKIKELFVTKGSHLAAVSAYLMKTTYLIALPPEIFPHYFVALW